MPEVLRKTLGLTAATVFLCALGFAQEDLPQQQRVCVPGMPCSAAKPAVQDPDVITSPDETSGQQQRQDARTAAREAQGEANAPGAQSNRPELRLESVRQPIQYTEFQKFVSASVGRMLPIYGQNLFENVPSTFAPVDRIPVTADYVVGPGDELVIRGWGQVQINVRATVDRTGSIFIPKVGEISVAGLKYQQLQPFLHSQIARTFQNFELTVTLGQLRSIQVFVVGQAKRPGTYTVSSLSTVVNTLFASGGPSTNGSMRRIQLKRNGAIVSEFDMYDLLLKGDKSKDVTLLPGDVVYIPPVGPQVAVAGSVNVPAIYELKGSMTLEDTISMTGGFTSTAAGQKATVERIENRSVRRIETFLLDAEGMKRPIQDGDLVNIISLSPRFENSVTLRGNVAQPGRYPWHKDMRVGDLIPNREFLITREYWSNQNRVSELAQQSNAHADQTVLRNDIKLNAPEINWDYAVIQRLNYDDLSTRLLPFNLGKAILDHDDESNLLLQPGDIVTIFSQADLKVPVAKQTKLVRLEGEFKASGVYQVEAGETLRDVISRAGGLTSNAYLYAAEFTRESAREEQQKRLDDFLDDMERNIERTSATAGRNLTGAEDAAALQQKLEGQRRLLGKLRQVQASGRVVLNLKPTDNDANALPDLVLEDGDRLFVPNRPDTVGVIGSVYNENSFLYKRGSGVTDYVRLAGGTRRDADSSRMFVIRADGSVMGRSGGSRFWTGGLSSMRMMPGDTVVVPERLDSISFMKGLKDWTQIISQFAIGVAAIKVIKNP